MKATRYFSDYQSAYNYYGGNVVPSTEIALIGDGSYIFVSSDNAVSGNQQYFDVSMTNDEIVDTMTYTAYNNGVSYGEAVGFETGYTAGTTYGEAIGYAQGYEGGYSYGYSYGYSEGEAQGGGSSTLTIDELNNMSFGFVMNEILKTGAQYARIEMCDLDVIGPGDVSQMFYSTGLHFVVDKYNDSTGLTADYNWTYAVEDDSSRFFSATVSLNAGDEVGFTLAPAVDDGMGGYAFEDECTWLYRYVDPENTGNGYNTHFFHVDNTGDYEFKMTISDDPETGDSILSWTFTEVQS